VALVLIAYTIKLWLGEALRDALFPDGCLKRKLFSGLFVLLMLSLSPPEYLKVSCSAFTSFAGLPHDVRTLVRRSAKKEILSLINFVVLRRPSKYDIVAKLYFDPGAK
jgi:hypothetical protein